MRCFRFLPFRISLSALLALCALSATPALAQQTAPVSGIVTTPAGRPLAGAIVFSGPGIQPEQTTTGAFGHFLLQNSTNVLHLSLDGYQPLTILVNPPAADLRIQLHAITLAPLAVLSASECAPLSPGDPDLRRLGQRGGGLQFDVPRHGWDIRDLGEGNLQQYVLQPRHSDAQLILWFGADSILPNPEDHFFIQSASFAQRAIVVSGQGAIGIDSYGTFPDGSRWRHTAASGAGATYDRASPDDAALFDYIIDSLCVPPGS